MSSTTRHVPRVCWTSLASCLAGEAGGAAAAGDAAAAVVAAAAVAVNSCQPFGQNLACGHHSLKCDNSLKLPETGWTAGKCLQEVGGNKSPSLHDS